MAAAKTKDSVMQPADLKSKTTRGFVWSALETWSSQLLSFLGLIVLARLLSPAEFGVVASAAIIVAVAQVFVHQGFADALIQLTDPEEAHYSSVFWLNMGMALLFSAALYLGAGVIADIFSNQRIESILQWLSPIFIVQAASKVQEARLRRELNFRSLAIRRALGSAGGVLLGIAAAFAGWGAMSLVVQQLVIEGVGALILWVASDWRPRWLISWSALQNLLPFSASMLGLSLLTFVNTRTDDLAITLKLGAGALGVYSVGYSILRALNNAFNGIVLRVAFPSFCRSRTDRDLLETSFASSLRLAAYIGFPCFTVIILLADDIVRIAFGAAWSESGPVLQILAASAFSQVPASFAMILIRAVGKPHWNFLYLGVVSLGFVVGCSAFAQYGIAAVALVITAVNFLALPLAVRLAQQLAGAKISWFALPIWPALVSSLCAAVAVLFLQQHLSGWPPLARLIVLAFCLLTLYTAVLAAFDPVNTVRRFAGTLTYFRRRVLA